MAVAQPPSVFIEKEKVKAIAKKLRTFTKQKGPLLLKKVLY